MFIPSMDKPLDDITHPNLEPFLRNLQGNILKAHGRKHAAVLVISFGLSDGNGADPVSAKAWIRSIASTRITSAFEQERQKFTDLNGLATFQTLALSSRGYEFLSVRPVSC